MAWRGITAVDHGFKLFSRESPVLLGENGEIRCRNAEAKRFGTVTLAFLAMARGAIEPIVLLTRYTGIRLCFIGAGHAHRHVTRGRNHREAGHHGSCHAVFS